MAVNHRALFTWFMLLVFLILLVLRLDQKAIWNWFIIFIPMWLFDGIIIVYILFYMITHCKTGWDRAEVSMVKKVWFLTAMILKLAFQVMLCLRLEYFPNFPLYYIMIPMWILLCAVCVDIFRTLILRFR